jgi:hypothetical protein
MSKNVAVLPFTEIVERVVQMARIREESRDRIRAMANDIYSREIPRKEDWTFFIARTSLSITAQYNAGTVTATTGNNSVTFTGASLDTSMVGRRLTFGNVNGVYDFYYGSSSSGTIGPPLMGNQNISGGSYTMYQSLYSLPKDFDRFVKNGGLHLYQGGKLKVIPEKNYDYYADQFQSTPNDNTEFCRVVGYGNTGQRQVEVVPPPMSQGSWEMDYLTQIKPLRESTAGTISVTGGATAVTGVGTNFTSMNTGDYIRVDAFGTAGDSEWYRVNTITSDTAIVLDTVWGTSGASNANYTISSVPKMPENMQASVLYGTLASIEMDQNDPMATSYKQTYAEILSDGKRMYRSRLIRSDVPMITDEYHYRR